MSMKSKTISQKISELDELIAWFDSDDFSLEQAIDRYKKANELADDITSELATLKNDVRLLGQKFDEQ